MQSNIKKEAPTTPTKATVEASRERKRSTFSLPFYHKNNDLSTIFEYSTGITDPNCVVCGKTFIKYLGREYAYGDCCSHSCKKKQEREELKQRTIPNAKPVVQKERDSEKIIASFPSAEEAARYMGMKKADNIRDCCNRKTKTSAGYIWRWKEETND